MSATATERARARMVAPKQMGAIQIETTSPKVEERLPPKREAAQTRVRRSPRRLTSIKERLNHKRGSADEITFDERDRNAQDTKTTAPELSVARGVGVTLPLVERIPINLDDERSLASEEVDDMIADDDLAPKLDAEQAATAHDAPHQRFRRSRMVSKAPSALIEERFARSALS